MVNVHLMLQFLERVGYGSQKSKIEPYVLTNLLPAAAPFLVPLATAPGRSKYESVMNFSGGIHRITFGEDNRREMDNFCKLVLQLRADSPAVVR
jgi:hypothetical protein